ncbi:unnamed protein product [Amoebophrya sp. A120]|nr:unnamed protein product [Amoebophrya sp. A120]|eukprot:GSA120T00012431001.1
MRRGSLLRYLVPAHQLVVLQNFLDVKRGVAAASSGGGPAEADLPGEQPTKNSPQVNVAVENIAQAALLDNNRNSVPEDDPVSDEQDPNYDSTNYRELSTDDDFYNDTNSTNDTEITTSTTTTTTSSTTTTTSTTTSSSTTTTTIDYNTTTTLPCQNYTITVCEPIIAEVCAWTASTTPAPGSSSSSRRSRERLLSALAKGGVGGRKNVGEIKESQSSESVPDVDLDVGVPTTQIKGTAAEQVSVSVLRVEQESTKKNVGGNFAGAEDKNPNVVSKEPGDEDSSSLTAREMRMLGIAEPAADRLVAAAGRSSTNTAATSSSSSLARKTAVASPASTSTSTSWEKLQVDGGRQLIEEVEQIATSKPVISLYKENEKVVSYPISPQTLDEFAKTSLKGGKSSSSSASSSSSSTTSSTYFPTCPTDERVGFARLELSYGDLWRVAGNPFIIEDFFQQRNLGGDDAVDRLYEVDLGTAADSIDAGEDQVLVGAENQSQELSTTSSLDPTTSSSTSILEATRILAPSLPFAGPDSGPSAGEIEVVDGVPIAITPFAENEYWALDASQYFLGTGQVLLNWFKAQNDRFQPVGVPVEEVNEEILIIPRGEPGIVSSSSSTPNRLRQLKDDEQADPERTRSHIELVQGGGANTLGTASTSAGTPPLAAAAPEPAAEDEDPDLFGFDQDAALRVLSNLAGNDTNDTDAVVGTNSTNASNATEQEEAGVVEDDVNRTNASNATAQTAQLYYVCMNATVGHVCQNLTGCFIATTSTTTTTNPPYEVVFPTPPPTSTTTTTTLGDPAAGDLRGRGSVSG